MKTEEEYTDDEMYGGGSRNSQPTKKQKPNLSLIAFIVIALLTTLILISC